LALVLVATIAPPLGAVALPVRVALAVGVGLMVQAAAVAVEEEPATQVGPGALAPVAPLLLEPLAAPQATELPVVLEAHQLP
jgi:hypothetical protein